MGLCLPQNLTNPPFLLLKATASTAIINFAPSLLVSEHSGGSGLSGRDAVLLSTSIAVTKAVGVLAGLLLVDRVGRRPLLIGGAAGCTASMAALTLAGWATASSTGNGSDGGGGSSGKALALKTSTKGIFRLGRMGSNPGEEAQWQRGRLSGRGQGS